MTTPEPYISVRPVILLNNEIRADMSDRATGVRVLRQNDGLDHMELALLNWGGDERGNPGFLFNDVAPGDALAVHIGGRGSRAIFEGEVTAMEERYGNAAPAMVILAENALHKMVKRRASRVFEERSVNEALSTVIGDHGLSPDVNVSEINTTLHQLNESDLSFIHRVAGRFFGQVRLSGATLSVKPWSPTPEPIEITMGDDVIDARIITDLNLKPGAVSYGGFNPVSGETVTGTADSATPPSQGQTAPGSLRSLGWSAQWAFTTPFPMSGAEADAQARAAMDARGIRFTRGEITCAGNPDLATGDEILLKNVSRRLEGKYRITSCSHLFDPTQGYRTILRVGRNDWND